MIDKPKDKVEALVEGFFGRCASLRDGAARKLEKPLNGFAGLRNRHPRFAAAIVATVCISAAGLGILGFAMPRTVIVNIDDTLEVKTTEYETTCKRVDTFLDTHGIDYVPLQDQIDVEMSDGISNNMEINILKAVEIPVTADGQTQTVVTLPTTVDEIIAELGIYVGSVDIVEPEESHMLQKGDHIYVRRVTTGEVTEEVTTDYKSRYAADSSMAIGKMQTTSKGQPEIVKNTYLVTYIDGEESERELKDTEVLQEKQDKVISYGTKILSGKPSGLKYKEVISGVRAVSYHFDGNPRGASGNRCKYGTCAVDPDVIPLGTSLYIEGYGYAVANDVGSSIKGNTIDVYMEKANQCGIWGARTVKVYVLD